MHAYELGRMVRTHITGGARFAITAGVIFVMLFVGMNFGAYHKQISHYLKSNVLATKADVLSVAGSGAVNRTVDEKTGIIKIAKHTTGTLDTMPTLAIDVVPPVAYLHIPRLDISAPIVAAPVGAVSGEKMDTMEGKIQTALKDGVVHFPGTAAPGSTGNAFITGHSSYYPFAPGRYKDVFALLPQAQIGDEIIVEYAQKRYTYIVQEMKEVSPKDVDVLQNTTDKRLTLMTCTPIGTALQRLIVTATLKEETMSTPSVAMLAK